MFTKVLKISRARAIAALHIHHVEFTDIAEYSGSLYFKLDASAVDSDDFEGVANKFAEDVTKAMGMVVPGPVAGNTCETLLNSARGMVSFRMYWTRQELSVHDLIEDWGSYLHDMEHNLEMDAHTWARYQKNPVPTYKDLLMDFGKFPTEDYDEIVKIVDNAARNYNGEM